MILWLWPYWPPLHPDLHTLFLASNTLCSEADELHSGQGAVSASQHQFHGPQAEDKWVGNISSLFIGFSHIISSQDHLQGKGKDKTDTSNSLTFSSNYWLFSFSLICIIYIMLYIVYVIYIICNILCIHILITTHLSADVLKFIGSTSVLPFWNCSW